MWGRRREWQSVRPLAERSSACMTPSQRLTAVDHDSVSLDSLAFAYLPRVPSKDRLLDDKPAQHAL